VRSARARAIRHKFERGPIQATSNDRAEPCPTIIFAGDMEESMIADLKRAGMKLPGPFDQ
jgi:hypothetical protein